MQHSQMFNIPKNAIWQFFHQLLKSALETQIKVYAAFENVQQAEKRYLTVFSNHHLHKSTLETQLKACAAFTNVQHA